MRVAKRSDLRGLLKIRPVDLDGSETGFPGIPGRKDTRTGPAGGIGGQVVFLDVDLESGAGLSPFPDPHLDVGIGTVDQPALELAGGLVPRGPGIDDPMAPSLAGAFEHGAEPRVVLYRRPGPGEVEVDRQGVGGAALPAPVGDAAVGAEDPDFVIIGETRSHGTLALRLHRGLERSKAVRVVLRCRFRQGKSLGNLLNAPVSPMVEKIGRFRVVARKLGQTLAAGGRATAGGLVSRRRIATRDPVIRADTRSIVRKVQPRLVAGRPGPNRRDLVHSRLKARARKEARGILSPASNRHRRKAYRGTRSPQRHNRTASAREPRRSQQRKRTCGSTWKALASLQKNPPMLSV